MNGGIKKDRGEGGKEGRKKTNEWRNKKGGEDRGKEGNLGKNERRVGKKEEKEELRKYWIKEGMQE